MIRSIKKIICILFGAVLLCTFYQQQARAAEVYKKSEKMALFLGVDPIPGDALYYGCKHIQGTINLLLGTAGGATFFISIYEWAEGCNSSGDPGDCLGMAKIGTAIGGLVYFSSLIWDAVGGILSVKAFNNRNKDEVTLGLALDMDGSRPVIGARLNF